MVKIISCEGLSDFFYDSLSADGIVFDKHEEFIALATNLPEKKSTHLVSRRPVKLSKGKKSK